jgi:hypothetical protein
MGGVVFRVGTHVGAIHMYSLFFIIKYLDAVRLTAAFSGGRPHSLQLDDLISFS